MAASLIPNVYETIMQPMKESVQLPSCDYYPDWQCSGKQAATKHYHASIYGITDLTVDSHILGIHVNACVTICMLLITLSHMTVKYYLVQNYQSSEIRLRKHTFQAEGPTFQSDCTCQQRPPVMRDHIFRANGMVFQDRFYFKAWNIMQRPYANISTYKARRNKST